MRVSVVDNHYIKCREKIVFGINNKNRKQL
jgi:hypothetical protein